MRPLLTYIILITNSIVFAQPPIYEWAESIGSAFEFTEGKAATVDDFGNTYFTGYFNGTIDFDPGPNTYLMTSAGFRDVFIQKLDSLGSFIWAYSIGGVGEDIGNEIQIDSNGNLIVAGKFHDTIDLDPGLGTNIVTTSSPDGNGFIISLDPSGSLNWATTILATGNFEINDLEFDSDENIYISGLFYDTLYADTGLNSSFIVSAGSGDPFLRKINSTGGHIWTKHIAGPYPDMAMSITIDDSNRITMTGAFGGTTDLDWGPGTYMSSVIGNYNSYVIQCDTSANISWIKVFKNNYYPQANTYAVDVTSDSYGNVYICGSALQQTDFDPSANEALLNANGCFVTKLSVNGDFDWLRNIDAHIVHRFSGFQLAINDSILYASGNFSGVGDFDPGSGTYELTSGSASNTFLWKLDLNGSYLWAGCLCSNDENKPEDLIFSEYGRIYIGGTMRDTTDLDPTQGSSIFPANAFASRAYLIQLNDDNSLNIGEISAPNIYIYPNPANELINIYTGEKLHNLELNIISTTGQVVSKTVLEENQNSINIQGISPGNYTLQICHDGIPIGYKSLIKN